MKRFLTALAIGALFFATNGAYAQQEFAWTFAGSGNWAVNGNWTVIGKYPGGQAMNARSADHATIAKTGVGGAYTITFANTDGSTTFGKLYTADLVVDAGTAAQNVTLNITGDMLFPGRTKLISGASGNITIDLDASGRFDPEDLEVVASTGTVIFDHEADMKVAGETVMEGDVDITVADEKVFDVGLLILKQGTTVTKTNAGTDGGVFKSS